MYTHSPMIKNRKVRCKLNTYNNLYTGIDIGSTTTKTVVINSADNSIIYSDYQRHHANQAESVKKALEKLYRRFGNISTKICLTGSGAKHISIRTVRLRNTSCASLLPENCIFRLQTGHLILPTA